MGLSVQSKLLAMLLAVSLVSAGAVGALALHFGTSSLRDAVEQELVEVRQSRTRELTQYFDSLQSSVVTNAQGSTAVDAVRAFTTGFRELDRRPENDARAAALRTYYDQSVVTPYREQTGITVDTDALLPRSSAQQYLQATYTATTTDFTRKLALDDAGDGSSWSAANNTYQAYFRSLVENFDYRDVFLLDTRGNVVYSAYKGTDLGTNVRTGPYRGGGLERVYDAALRSNATDSFTLSDFQPYQPSLDAPTSFAASPILSDGELEGVLVVQLPLERINDITTDQGRWAADGLGSSGEVYLVGRDTLMRSASRTLLEDPTAYREEAIKAGTPPEVADRAVAAQSSVLIQPVGTPAVDKALRGKRGLTVAPAYLGADALTAYAPLDVDGLDWAIIAQVETAEAYTPATEFARNLGVLTAALILLVSLASLLLARVFTRPLARLVAAVRKVAAGDLSTEVPVTTRDEFGDVGTAFNDMNRSLRTKAEMLIHQLAENERLLHMIMPAAIAERYRDGEATIAHEKQDVSVIFADLVGIEGMSHGRSPAEMLALTNSLARSFDQAAEELGIERVRSVRTGYLASCGAVVPRLDNARRTVAFAQRMEQIVHRFNARHGFDLALRVGIDTGTVTAGLVGSAHVVYDLWGDAVNLAHQACDQHDQSGIFVTARVHDRVRDEFDFRLVAADAPARDTVWMLDAEMARV